jgi:hypothetical protein
MSVRTLRGTRLSFAAFLFLGGVPLAEAQGITGEWNGTHQSDTVRCNPVISSSGPAKLVAAQSGTAISGRLTFNWLNVDVGNPCVATSTVVAFDVNIVGSLNGTVLAGQAFLEPGSPFPLAGTVSGNDMTFTITVPNDTPPPANDTVFAFTLTRSLSSTPNVVVSAFPTGMIQALNQATGTDSISLTNIGASPAILTLAPSGGFFTIAPTSLTLAARETRVVSIQALAQTSAGAQTGSIAVSGGGAAFLNVRVALLTTNPPTSTVRLLPPSTRPEVISPATTGAALFTNTSSQSVQAIAVADVPWITPQTGAITLQPGQPTAVNFTIDRTKRPDSAAPLGGAAGRLALRFIGGPTPAVQTLGSTTIISTVSVKVVDIVPPGTTAGSLAAIPAGQVAYFVPGLGVKANTVSDLFLSNRGSSTATDFRFYFISANAGSTPLVMNLPQGIASNVPLSFPSASKTVFGGGEVNGSLQIRGSSLDSSLSVAIVRQTSTPTGTYSTALPHLRSDSGVGASGSVILAGVEKGNGVRTNLYVQETTGISGASVTVDFLDANGLAVGATRAPDAIGGFRMLELTDVVPTGAVVARVRNTSSAGGPAIAAYALVIDDTTSDAWVVSDLMKAQLNPPTSFIVPLITLTGTSPKRELFLTNAGDSQITATVDAVSPGSSRRRASVHAYDATPLAQQSFIMERLRTTKPELSITTGYLKLTATAGTLTGSARITTPNSTGGSFGTGLAAVPTVLALANGQSKRFTGVDDAAPATLALATSGTNRSSLILIETAGQSATVNVTLRYMFPGGSLVTAIDTRSKEFTLTAGQMLTLADIARTVIGSPERDAYGDLSNMQLDVQVISGLGRVVALLHSLDNGTGDVMMRVD